MDEKNVLIIEVDHNFLQANADKLQQLADLYCQVWMYDEHFGEFRKCPECGSYFSFTQVTVDGITTCNSDHPSAGLVPAWDIENVKAEILDQASQDFFGVVAVNTVTNTIIGFAWGRLIDFDEIRESWGDTFITKLRQQTDLPQVAYFDELGVDCNRRTKGLGTSMAEMVCRWMRDNYPNHMGLLRTHRDSAARTIYERIGYDVFAEDTQHGQGRVMMCVHPTSKMRA